MRYKKKKRQIVSAALAAMMAMQLCIPSATFAAVPTKKLKVITGFTELPEEVAHIQIPADAGENFEDYLNFPETIEASVVEYKNVDHQKNNADRDKGAEDEKAAADDRDKKEDSEIATGSNAKKENLNEEETPETENSENVPDSNDEEEADKQEVQEKDQQKDQQGTFLIATDSNAGDFLEDYEFEDEEISEDIPVLTDISVTWEPDENREDESGFYYYLPVLPREYILAAGVELPEIEVSMDGGIALLASTGTYNIAKNGIGINSDTLAQYNNATITGTSTTNIILVNGVDVTITISNLDIQIPHDKNDDTARTWVPAIQLMNGAHLNLILKEKNTLKGGDNCAAIEVPEGCTLTISGEGSLTATGGEGAGIGASSLRNGSLGTIEINGGDIKAYGGVMAAGIGGSAESGSGTIIINNGTVYAKGGHGSYHMNRTVYGGAGIGGGVNGCVDKIEINGGKVTACGGYTKNAGMRPGAGIGCGGGGAKAVVGGYRCGEIVINGGTVSAIAYQNEVYAIGMAVKPDWSLPQGSTLDGSISISDKAVVNLNGGDYFPKSENFGLKNYTIQGTIDDGRLTESSYPVTISVGEITWDAGTMKVSGYKGTFTASNYLKPSAGERKVVVKVGDKYVYQMGNAVFGENEKNPITLTKGIPLYETKLKFVSMAINRFDDPLEVSQITIKQDGTELVNKENDIAKMVLPSKTIAYGGDNKGYLTVYLPKNAGRTEISVTVPKLNGGQPIVKSDQTISATNSNEIEMYVEDTSCKHESFDADGFCNQCKEGYQPATKNKEGVYEIRNAGQLFWFAEQFNNNGISHDSSLKLMKDIDIPDRHPWKKIGDVWNNQFHGNIDGNYHVISGLQSDDTNHGMIGGIAGGKVTNLGLAFERTNGQAWLQGLCYSVSDGATIENCFAVGDVKFFLYAVYSGTVKNCFTSANNGMYQRSSSGNYVNCYQSVYDGPSSKVIYATKEQFKSGEIAYRLNADNNVVWGQNIGKDAYPQFVKYSKRVYYDANGNPKYYNDKQGEIVSATVTDITTNSATIKVTVKLGNSTYDLRWLEGDHTVNEVQGSTNKINITSKDKSEQVSIPLTGLQPGTEYRYSLQLYPTKEAVYVDFQTQQAAPTQDAVSIDYEREILKNVSDVNLEYAESAGADSWISIFKNSQLSLTSVLDQLQTGKNKTLYVRKKASSSGPVSEAVAVKIPARPVIADNQKPAISYTNETITVSAGIEYQIGTTEPTYWASAKKGNGKAVTIADNIPAHGTSATAADKVYYRIAASNQDKHFASKAVNIAIPARPKAPAGLSTKNITATSRQIKLDDSAQASAYEYGIREVGSTGTTFTWQTSPAFTNLQPAVGYEIARRMKAVEASGNKPGQFASELSAIANVTTKDVLRVIGSGTPKWVTSGTYGDSLDKISVSLASGYHIYNSSNQTVAGKWKFADTQIINGSSKKASEIYPNVKGTQGYTVIFEPSGVSNQYDSDAALSDTVTPTISKKKVTVTVNVNPRAYSVDDTTADVPSPLTVGTGVNTGDGEEQLEIKGLTGSYTNPNAGTGKKILLDSSKAEITGIGAADLNNYEVIIPAETTGDITPVSAQIQIDNSKWPAQKTYGDASFPLSGVTWIGDGAVTYASDNESVLTVDADGWATIHGAGTTMVTIRMENGTNYTANDDSRPITVQKGTISLNLKAGKKTGLMQRLLAVLGNVEDTYVLTLEAKGVYQDVLAGTVIFYENGQPLNQTPIPLTNGTASMEYSVPSVGTHEISAKYVLPADGAEKENYNKPAPVSCSFEVGKADEDKVQIEEVNGKIYGDDPFALVLTGQKGKGAVKFSVPADNGVLELSGVNGKTEAKIIGAGTVLVTAEVAGDTGYNGTTVTREITIGKAQTPEVSVAAPKIAPVPADAPEEVKAIANLLENNAPEITGLDTAAADLIGETENGDVTVKTGEDQTISGVEAKEKLQKERIDTAEKKVRLVVEPYMSVEVKGVTEKQGVNVITFEINALYNVKATTAGKKETMQEEGTGKNTVLIGSAIPQKIGIPVTITLPLPAGYPTEALFIRHLLHNGGIAYYPVTVRVKQGSAMAEFVNKDGFSTFELLSDSRKGTVAFDNGVGERSYTLEQMDEALPTVSKDGAVFKGWKINGTLYTTVNEALLDALDQAEGHRVTAQAVLESSSPETPDDSKGDRNTGSDSDREDTDRNVTRNAWKTKKVNGVVRWSYYDSDGRRVSNAWKQLLYEGTMFWYHFGADGYMDTGWFKDADGNWYYLDPVSDGAQGAMKTGWLKDADGNWYYLNPVSDGTRGAMKTGWFKDVDGNWYYLNPVSDGTKGAMKTGWFTDPQDGHLYYLDPKTGAMVTGRKHTE